MVQKTNDEMKKRGFWSKNQHLLYTGLSLIFILIALLIKWIGAINILHISFFIIATLLGGKKNIRNGIPNLLKLNFNMDALMTIAVIGAVIIGYYEEAAVVAFLFGVSEALEVYTMDRARRSITSLMEITPKKANILRDKKEVEIAVEKVNIGDIMIVKPGEKLAMDGKVIRGLSSINQSAITGESIPIEKGIGDKVFAGTLNQTGYIEVEVTKLIQDTTISKIIEMVEDAQEQRAPSQAFIDKFAKYYTPVIMVFAAIIAVFPPLLFDGEWNTWIYNGLALLIVGCPCALVVSTPVAIVTSIGIAAKNGVLIKGGIHLENVSTLNAIAFDKTGTLTYGRPVITDIVSTTGIDENRLLSFAAGIEKLSEHPLATAIIKKAEEKDLKIAKVEHFKANLGKGINAEIDGEDYTIGSKRLFEELQINIADYYNMIEQFQEEGKTVILLAKQDKIIAIFAVADELRSKSDKVFQLLKKDGIKKTIMLTGDNKLVAKAISQKIGIDEYRADLLPEEKVKAVKELSSKYQKVGMVGDGINDSPALATATTGIAMGVAGVDVALETADIVLMSDDLSKLSFAIRLGKTTLTIIKQNIFLALSLKAIAVLLVFPGWLTLWIAILADMGATILVTLNALRLLSIKTEGK